MIRHDMPDNEAVELAHIVLADSNADPTAELYALTVHEARTLARAVVRALALADRLDREGHEVPGRPVPSWTGRRIRAALNGEIL